MVAARELDPSPSGEGGRREAPDGWGRRPQSTLPVALPRTLRKRLTPQEVKVWNWLRENFSVQGHHFRRQVAIGRFIVDFACLRRKLIVEIDGGGHGRADVECADIERDAHLAAQGFRVLRFWNAEIDFEKQMVLNTIHAHLSDPSLSPPVRRFAPATLP
ncbi:MAG: endonuclease domain-containing protein [Beijerinckiaceae bacterium]